MTSYEAQIDKAYIGRNINPAFPVYIVSKGRWDSRLTYKYMEHMGVPCRLIIEEHEFNQYAAVIDKSKLLILDKSYQRDYDTCDNLGDTKSKGPGPARNFALDHSCAHGFDWHWVLDDNIRFFARLNLNLKVYVKDGTIFRCMEDFVLRYSNVDMAGPQYEMFVPRKSKVPPFTLNTRIYSCNFINNRIKFRWRGRYNEDTDLSLRILKSGRCTILFNTFLQHKVGTQVMRGGNTDEFYSKEGTLAKSQMLVRLHPDVTRLVIRFGRPHHRIDYRGFKKNGLIARPGLKISNCVDDYGMELVTVPLPVRGAAACLSKL